MRLSADQRFAFTCDFPRDMTFPSSPVSLDFPQSFEGEQCRSEIEQHRSGSGRGHALMRRKHRSQKDKFRGTALIVARNEL